MQKNLSERPCPGTVTLVGAGPGDPELLTLKALKAIQAASVLLVDDLVSPEIVALAAPGARVVYVGKRGGCKSTPQAFIERLMLTAAQAGERVVRLKGGDPFLFGRGGEEVRFLQSMGVPVQVVNGITAGLAAASSLHVPLTHRDAAHGVLFLTGHPSAGPHATQWNVLAQTAQLERLTLVIYMGVSGVAHIQSGLLQGLPASTPAAIVQNASLPQQRQVRCTLGDLSQAMLQAGIASPAVIVVGDVLAMEPGLAQHLAASTPAQQANAF